MKKIQNLLVALLLLSGVQFSAQAQAPKAPPTTRPVGQTAPPATPLSTVERQLNWRNLPQPTTLERPTGWQPLRPEGSTPPSPWFTPKPRPVFDWSPPPPASPAEQVQQDVANWWARTRGSWESKIDRYREHPGELAAERPFSDVIQAGLHAFWDDVLRPLLKGIWLLLLYPLWQGLKRRWEES